MATATTIVLSSSPCRSPIAVTPTHAEAMKMSSSPNLPSPSSLFLSMPSKLQSGSNLTPVPKDAIVGFASASTLLRQARLSEDQGTISNVKRLGLAERLGARDSSYLPAKSSSQKGENAGKEETPIFRKPAVQEGHQPLKKQLVDEELRRLPTKVSESKRPRLGKMENAGKENDPIFKKPTALEGHKGVKNSLVDGLLQDSTSKVLPSNKSRQKINKDNKDEGQMKIAKPKITKCGTSKSIGKQKGATTTSRKAKPQVSGTLNTLLPSQEEDAKAREEFRGLCLEKAIPIRREWTPCRDTVRKGTPPINLEDGSTFVLPADTPVSQPPHSLQFGQILENFGYVQDENNPVMYSEEARRIDDETVIKRRKIEVIGGINIPPCTKKAKKIKSPKKKPQTITKKATGPFMTADTMEAPSLLQYFSSQASVTEAPSNGPNEETPMAVKRRSTAKNCTKRKASAIKVKKSTKPLLLSPETAIKKLDNQEMVFGTASQLAREESPTMIRDLHQAMEASAELSQEWGVSNLPAGGFRSSHSLALARSRNLWSVASRNTDGALLEVDTVDLSTTPKMLKDSTKADPLTRLPGRIEGDRSPQQKQRSQDIPEVVHVVPSLDFEATPKLQQQVRSLSPPIPRSVAEAALKKRPSNRSAVKNATNSKENKKEMPNYQGFEDIQLDKEVKAYGFKAIKSRKAKIALLEQCWESKISMALQEVQVNLQPTGPVANSTVEDNPVQVTTPKQRGRPPKSSPEQVATARKGDAGLPKKPRGRPKNDPTTVITPPKRKGRVKAQAKEQTKPDDMLADDTYDSALLKPSPPRLPSSKSPGKLQIAQSDELIKSPPGRRKGDNAEIFEQITKAVKTFPPTQDPKNLTFNEKILMYEPIVLEDLTVWLNSVGLAKVGEDDEVAPLLVKQWCEERSICCLWRENLRGVARGRW